MNNKKVVRKGGKKNKEAPVCERCGNPMRPRQRFCRYCGLDRFDNNERGA